MSRIIYGDGSGTPRPRSWSSPQPHHASAASGGPITNRPGPKILAPQFLLASGPVFALVQPVSHIVET
jgi:hypothetical protein